MRCPEQVVATNILCSKSHKEWIIFSWVLCISSALWHFSDVILSIFALIICYSNAPSVFDHVIINAVLLYLVIMELAHGVRINNNWYKSYLKLHVEVDGGAEVVEGDKSVPRDVDPVLHDPVGDLAGQVEDGVLVRLDGLGGIDDEDQRGVERTVGGLTKSTLRGLRAGLAPGCCCRDLRVQ